MRQAAKALSAEHEENIREAAAALEEEVTKVSDSFLDPTAGAELARARDQREGRRDAAKRAAREVSTGYRKPSSPERAALGTAAGSVGAAGTTSGGFFAAVAAAASSPPPPRSSPPPSTAAANAPNLTRRNAHRSFAPRVATMSSDWT